MQHIPMAHLIKTILEHIPYPFFTLREITVLIQGTTASRQALLKRSVASGDILRIKRGLYALAPIYRKTPLHPYMVAQFIQWPSYISLESALSIHGWIPEAARTITSATTKRTTEYTTPIGHFAFHTIVQDTFMAGVERIEDANGNIWLQAKPLKALADYVYVHNLAWESTEALVESLRIDEDGLSHLTVDDFDELEGLYSSPRVVRFLKGIRKELRLHKKYS